MKIGGSIFGGLKASQAMKQAEKILKEQQRDNQDWYDRRYNEDATQRADAQRMLAMTMDAIRDRSMEAKGTQAVMGGTEESVAATKAANANALTDQAAQIAVSGLNRKDRIESEFKNRNERLNQQLKDLKINKANNITQAVGGVSSAAADIAGGALDDILVFGKKKDNEYTS